MAAAKRARTSKKQVSEAAAPLISALKFVGHAQYKAGSIEQCYSIARNGWLAASDGVLTIACKIEEDLKACPHTLQLLDALSKCEADLSITQLSSASLAVTSGNFRAIVTCMPEGSFSVPGPDPQCAVIGKPVLDALSAAAVLATEGAESALTASVLLQAGSCVGTNRFALLEAWHGYDLPPGLLIPKVAVNALSKCGKVPIGFGFSQSSATFYFEDESFIKTQLYNDRYINYAPLLESAFSPWPLPDEFFKGIRLVESFSKSGNVYFDKECILSREDKELSTIYKVEGLPDGMGFNSKYLLLLEPHFKSAYFNKLDNKVWFYGPTTRGVLQGLEVASSDFDDNIPF